MKVDLELTEQNGIYDIDFDDDGDFAMTEGFDTALLMSLLTDKRASASEMPAPELRRGWWGNLLNDVVDYEIGSKLWLLSQARKTESTLNSLNDFTEESLQWLADDRHLDEVRLTVQYIENKADAFIELIRFQDIVFSKSVEIWNNTGL